MSGTSSHPDGVSMECLCGDTNEDEHLITFDVTLDEAQREEAYDYHDTSGNTIGVYYHSPYEFCNEARELRWRMFKVQIVLHNNPYYPDTFWFTLESSVHP